MAIQDSVIVIVDPYSTGALVSLEAFNRGYTVIALWTDEEGGYRGHKMGTALRNDLVSGWDIAMQRTLTGC